MQQWHFCLGLVFCAPIVPFANSWASCSSLGGRVHRMKMHLEQYQSSVVHPVGDYSIPVPPKTPFKFPAVSKSCLMGKSLASKVGALRCRGAFICEHYWECRQKECENKHRAKSTDDYSSGRWFPEEFVSKRSLQPKKILKQLSGRILFTPFPYLLMQLKFPCDRIVV